MHQVAQPRPLRPAYVRRAPTGKPAEKMWQHRSSEYTSLVLHAEIEWREREDHQGERRPRWAVPAHLRSFPQLQVPATQVVRTRVVRGAPGVLQPAPRRQLSATGARRPRAQARSFPWLRVHPGEAAEER